MNPTASNTVANAQLVRDVRESLFDTYTVAKTIALPLRIILFGNPATSGQAATNPQLTNLTQVGQLPNPETQDVYAVLVEFINCLAADVIGFCQNYVMHVLVSGRTLLTLPLCPVNPNGDGQWKITAIATDVVAFAQCRIDLPEDYKIEIASGAPFSVDFTSSTGYQTATVNGLGMTIRVRLDGIHTVLVN